MSKTPANKAPLSFEDALSELEKIVRQLESGAIDLQSSIEAYERGVMLKKQCEARLNEARMRIEKITLSDTGEATATPLQLSE